jgi:hypothetical protein
LAQRMSWARSRKSPIPQLRRDRRPYNCTVSPHHLLLAVRTFVLRARGLLGEDNNVEGLQ